MAEILDVAREGWPLEHFGGRVVSEKHANLGKPNRLKDEQPHLRADQTASQQLASRLHLFGETFPFEAPGAVPEPESRPGQEREEGEWEGIGWREHHTDDREGDNYPDCDFEPIAGGIATVDDDRSGQHADHHRAREGSQQQAGDVGHPPQCGTPDGPRETR